MSVITIKEVPLYFDRETVTSPGPISEETLLDFKEYKEREARSRIKACANKIMEYLTTLTFLSGSDICAGLLSTKVADRTGFCLSRFTPSTLISIAEFINKTHSSCLLTILNKLGITPNTRAEVWIASPIAEETEFRFLLQDILLKKLPESILKHFYPKTVNVTNTVTYRMLRVCLVATLFAAAHPSARQCAISEGGGLQEVIGGLTYGSLVEFGGDYISPLLMHIAYNSFQTSFYH